MDKVKHTIKRNPVIAKVKAADAKRKHKEGSRPGGYPLIYLNDEAKNSAKSNNFPSNTFTTAKYRWWTFPFKVLWEQFRKATTIYFTLIVIISLIPQISPITPWTSILGLLFIIVVAAVREGWEDFLRHKADRKVNQRRYHLIEPGSAGERVVTRSRWLAVGNLVYVKCDQQVPADMVVLTSSDPDHLCYIETSQLDGETNLKIRRSPPSTADMSLQEIASLHGTIQCESPHHQLYQFKASMSLGEDADAEKAQEEDAQATALDQGNLLLQSSFLRNTEWALGVIVYAGPETKLSLNQKKPPSKLSRLDTRLNYYVYILFVINMALCLTSAILAGFFEWKFASDAWYLPSDSGGPWLVGVKMFFSYFALLSYLIPLSLVVSLEMVKVFQARFMEWDEQMFKGNQNMNVKTSNLNDELGLVQYVFSDKTGTLTENQMDFMKCSINGTIYDNEALYEFLKKGKDKESEAVHNYLLAMALAHSAVTDTNKKTGDLIYKASSPDEEALCKAAHLFGYTFVSRSSQGITIRHTTPVDPKNEDEKSREASAEPDNEDEEEETYEQLCMMEFTSDRRRMSVVVKTPDGKIKLLSKGADTTMFERLKSGQEKIKAKASEDLDSFSQDGLRTLVYAEKEISESDWAAFDKEYQAASNMIEGREEAVEKLCDKLEKDMVLVGCSAIEDKLQPYVPETIDYLLKAGIRVWVITGDKQDTAINIGFSSKLLNSEMKICKINAKSSKKCGQLLVKAIKQIKGQDYEVKPSKKKEKKAHSGYQTIGDGSEEDESDEEEEEIEEEEEGESESSPNKADLGGADLGKPKKMACVIDGGTLKYALKNFPDELVEFTTSCHSVVCCRVTPLQKAKVVKLVRERQKAVCLSIGDGANDVSMIQEANIGVGIYGKEGNQAARAADFALRQFSHLRRLICVHGRYSMLRNAFLIHYSLYKNAAVFLCQLWFAFFCGFSGQTLYDDWIMTFFNITITAAPPLAVGVFEIDIYDHIIDKYPELYARTQKNQIFTLKTLSIWMVAALYQSLVAFFGTYAIFNWGLSKGGLSGEHQVAGFYVMGNVCLLIGMAGIFFKLAFHVTHWNWVVQIAVYGSVLLYLVTIILENVVSYIFPAQSWVVFYMFSMPSTWLWLILSVVLILLPDLICKFVKRAYFPEDWQVYQELDWVDKHPNRKFRDPLAKSQGDKAKSYGIRTSSINGHEHEAHQPVPIRGRQDTEDGQSYPGSPHESYAMKGHVTA